MEPSERNHLVSEVFQNAKTFAQSELKLASTEFSHAFDQVKSESRTLLIGSVVAFLGVPPFMAFLVVGLGLLLGDRYWLSALIVSVLFLGIGSLVAYRALKRINASDLSLPRTRRHLTKDGEKLQEKVRDMAQMARERAQNIVEISPRRPQ